jgi:hypothetical protein
MDIGESASGGVARTERVEREMAAARAALRDTRSDADTSMDEAVRRLLEEIAPSGGSTAHSPVGTTVVRSRREHVR